MTRNFENRIEVTCPIYNVDLQNQILENFKISWEDNVKSRLVNESKERNIKNKNIKGRRSQVETYNYFKNLPSK